MMFFAIFTALSALPFDVGYPGLEVMWTNSNSFVNIAKAVPENGGPLSDTTFFGAP